MQDHMHALLPITNNFYGFNIFTCKFIFIFVYEETLNVLRDHLQSKAIPRFPSTHWQTWCEVVLCFQMHIIVGYTSKSFPAVFTPIVILASVYLIMLPQTRWSSKSFVTPVAFIFLLFHITGTTTCTSFLQIPHHTVSFHCFV